MRHDPSGWPRQLLLTAITALAYWQAVNIVAGMKEPWDAPIYWTLAYPAALLIAALAGYLWRTRAWLTGSTLVLAQVPVMLVHTSPGPLALVGLAFLAVLTPPAILSAWIGQRLRR